MALGAVAAALLVTPAAADAAAYPPGFEERPIVSGLTGPTAVAWAPDGRLFITEKAGRLKVLRPGASQAQTILDISAKVNNYFDRGLLGLAVDSDFASNGFLYLVYTYEVGITQDGTGRVAARLSRIKVNADNTLANPSAPETVLIGSSTTACPFQPANNIDCIPADDISHTVGTVRSAPDGTLWMGTGDGASPGRVDDLALRTLDERSLAGKILHVDRNGRGLPGHPFCPTDTNLDDACTKVWAKGLRNPFRFKLRPGGGLTVGDPGWNTREEIDLVGPGGRSYGWPCYEGAGRTPGYEERSECAAVYAREGTPQAETPPDLSYGRTGSSAVLGGPTYAGDQYPPELRGAIFYGDYGQRVMKRLLLDSQGRVTGTASFATDWSGVDIEPAPDGDLAYVDIADPASASGSVKRIVYSPGNASPNAVATAQPTSGAPPLTVQFDGSGSSDADGDTLAYQWDFGDGTAQSSEASPSHEYPSAGTYTATLTVDDGRGLTDTDTVTISVGNTPPTAEIHAPPNESLYRDGGTVDLWGGASDPEQGTLPDSGFAWRADLVHIDHTHFDVFRSSGRRDTSFQALRDHDADSYYLITLSVTDGGGLSDQARVTIRPETVGLRLASVPAGAALSYAGRGVTAPFATSSAIGFRTTISAAPTFSSGGRSYVFQRWSDGGAASHDIVIPDRDTTLTAAYVARESGAGGSGSEPPASDRKPPRLSFSTRSGGLVARRGLLRGRAADASGVRRVEVALGRRVRRGPRCRWWSRRLRRLRRAAGSCRRPAWMRASLTPRPGGVAWRVRLGKRLPPGGYRLVFRAVDRLGNVGRELVGGRSLVRVKVRASRRSR